MAWRTFSNHAIFKRFQFACAAYMDRYILVAGGKCKERRNIVNLSSAVKYNMSKREFVTLPDLPFSGTCNGTVLDEFFYVASRDTLYRINLFKPLEWETVVVFSVGSAEIIVSDGINIFLVSHTCLFRFDPLRKQIDQMPSKKHPEYNLSASVVENKIIVLGGSSIRTMSVFDISSESWGKTRYLPLILYHDCTVVTKQWVIATGGKRGFGFKDYNREIFVFDTLTDRGWTDRGLYLIPPRQGHQCVIIDSHLVSVGGLGKITHKNRNSSIDAIYIKQFISSWNWERIKDFVLVRRLVELNRVEKDSYNNKNQITSSTKSDILRKIMWDLNHDEFILVMSFLI